MISIKSWMSSFNASLAFLKRSSATKRELADATEQAEEDEGNGPFKRTYDGGLHAMVIERMFERRPGLFDEMDDEKLLELQGLITYACRLRLRMISTQNQAHDAR